MHCPCACFFSAPSRPVLVTPRVTPADPLRRALLCPPQRRRRALPRALAPAAAQSALSLSPAPPRPVLAWDAQNYLLEFLDERLARADPWRALRVLEARVAEFAAAARRGGFRLVAVVDAATLSAEAGAKWRARRVREVTTERRNLVLGADVLLTDALLEAGVPVVRPLRADADDVLAALAASTPDGGVLSRDSDMFRYANPALAVYDGWRLEASADGGEEALVPTPAAPARVRGAYARSARDVQPALAAAALRELDDARSAASAILDKYAASARGGAVLRGSSSSSDRRRGNLHALARPLRAAVYARLREPGAVSETLPLWRDGAVAWVADEVAPDSTHDALLGDVLAAAAWLDARDGDDDSDGAHGADGALPSWPARELVWRAAERRFNRRVLAAELCAAAAAAAAAQGADDSARAAPPGSLLALLRRFDEYRAPSAAPDAAQQRLARVVTFEGGFDSDLVPLAATVVCVDCQAPFGLKSSEVNFFTMRGLHLPRRCKPCRDLRKLARS
jgi:hypothetical protein